MSPGKWIALVVGAVILQGVILSVLDASRRKKLGYHVDWNDSLPIGFLGALLVTTFGSIIALAIWYW